MMPTSPREIMQTPSRNDCKRVKPPMSAPPPQPSSFEKTATAIKMPALGNNAAPKLLKVGFQANADEEDGHEQDVTDIVDSIINFLVCWRPASG